MSSLSHIRNMLLISHGLNIISDEELILLMMGSAQKRARKSNFPYDDYEPFKLDDMNDEACTADFRFKKDHIHLLTDMLEIPDNIRLPGRKSVENVEALCLVLKQMACPCQKDDLVECFGRPMSDLRLITNTVIEILYRVHKHRVTKWNEYLLSPAHLQIYSAAICSKGAGLENCFGFVDCPVRPNKRKLFNGEKPVFSLKYQNVVLPSGMIAHTCGPIDGKKHDCSILGESGLLHDLEKFAFIPSGRAMCIYGEPLYPIRIHLKAPHKGPELTPEMEAFNKSMNEVSTATDWIFPDVYNSFKFLDYQDNKKISLDYVSKMHVVCCLLRNAQTCFYGNKTATFFRVQPPTILDYFT